MKQLLTRIMLILMLFSVIVAHANQSSSFIGPTLKSTYPRLINSNLAYSLLGELGNKNVRLNGTVGWEINEDQRLKISAEYLRQKLLYVFFTGESSQWTQQVAGGMAYQYDINTSIYQPRFNLSAYYSYAPNKNLSSVPTTIITGMNVFNLIDKRRIAGSNGFGFSPEIDFQPWRGGKLGAQLNYDHIHYRTKYIGNYDAIGFGGTLLLDQALNQYMNANVSAAFRPAFDYYTAGFNWLHLPDYKQWSFGVDGAYVAGKERLPSSYNIEFGVNYLLDSSDTQPVPHFKDPFSMASYSDPNKLIQWASKPAVYLPEVLAIAESDVSGAICPNGNVVLLSAIPNFEFDTFTDRQFIIDVAPFFSGNNIVYSLTQSNTFQQGPLFGVAVASIDSLTGRITIQGDPQPLFVIGTMVITVTASNGCASASSTFTTTLFSSD